jgi:hypothetical protein
VWPNRSRRTASGPALFVGVDWIVLKLVVKADVVHPLEDLIAIGLSHDRTTTTNARPCGSFHDHALQLNGLRAPRVPQRLANHGQRGTSVVNATRYRRSRKTDDDLDRHPGHPVWARARHTSAGPVVLRRQRRQGRVAKRRRRPARGISTPLSVAHPTSIVRIAQQCGPFGQLRRPHTSATLWRRRVTTAPPSQESVR